MRPYPGLGVLPRQHVICHYHTILSSLSFPSFLQKICFPRWLLLIEVTFHRRNDHTVSYLLMMKMTKLALRLSVIMFLMRPVIGLVPPYNLVEPLPSASVLTAALPPVVGPTVARAIELGAFPAIGMNIVTVLGLNFPTPSKLVGALQHFSAGILLTTVAKELLPEMVKAQGFVENAASGIGFFGGVGVLILLGILIPEEDEELEKEVQPQRRPTTSHAIASFLSE